MPKGVYTHKSPSKETIEKRRMAMKGRMPKNIVAGWNKGLKGCYKHSEETKLKMSGVKKGIRPKNNYKWKGKSHPNWKGGVSRDKHGNNESKIWRSKVFERDNWTCQTCGDRGCYLEAHHIKSWAKYPELRYVLDNGVTLCLPCHKLTDNYKGKNNKKL